MKELIVGLDGVTFQPVGELVFENGTTADQRSECKHTYRDCLRYVALSFLLGDRVGIPSNMPNVGKDSPGQNLADLLGKSLVLPINSSLPLNWDNQLMQNPAFERRVVSWLKLLDEAFSLRHSSWEDLVVREVLADYLGTDKGLTSHEVQPADLKLSAPHYVGHTAIQQMIPATFVAQLRERFKRRFRRLNVTDANIDEFISRMAVTHVVNYWKMNLDVENQHVGGFLRLPHMTRSSIRFAELRHSERSEGDNLEQQKRDQIMRALLPYPLRHLLRGLRKREDLIQRLLDLRDVKPFPRLRDRVKRALGELQQGKHRAAAKLCDEIEALSKSAEASGAEPTSLTFGIRVESDYSTTPFVDLPLDLLNKWFRPDRFCLEQLTTASERSEQRDLKRVFKELA